MISQVSLWIRKSKKKIIKVLSKSKIKIASKMTNSNSLSTMMRLSN